MIDTSIKISPELIEQARVAARTVSEHMAAISATTEPIQQPAVLASIAAMQSSVAAQNAQSILAQSQVQSLLDEINAPLAGIAKSIKLMEPSVTSQVAQISASIAAFSANTAALQSFSQTAAQLQNISASLVGRNSEFQNLLKFLGKNKDKLGVEPLKVANQSRQLIDQSINEKKIEIGRLELEQELAGNPLDMTLPAPAAAQGSVHPVSQVMDELAEIFADMGFAVAEGPEIEDQWHNFTALNMPETHPARAMHDTFYLRAADGEEAKVLRTHTSPVQIRTMMSQKPPIRIIAPGRVYRSDSDATHTPMFHQIEGLVIDKGINLGHLKWTLETFLKAFFERDDLAIRLRPSYFPFTEPSAEVDVSFSVENGKRVLGGTGGWMEVLGSGMVHPKVISACGLDPEVYQGFAFGTGVDRLAMLKYGMDDLRAFFDGDLRWLKHYGFGALDVPTLSGGVGA